MAPQGWATNLGHTGCIKTTLGEGEGVPLEMHVWPQLVPAQLNPESWTWQSVPSSNSSRAWEQPSPRSGISQDWGPGFQDRPHFRLPLCTRQYHPLFFKSGPFGRFKFMVTLDHFQ